MSFCIGGADLVGDWSPLLVRLPDWERVDGGWRSPSSHARIGCSRTKVFVNGWRPISLPDTEMTSTRPRTRDRFQLCHASYAVTDLPSMQVDLIRDLAPDSYFGRREVFDPGSGTIRADVHLIKGRDYYITLFSGETNRLDHVGWWCHNKGDVDFAAGIFQNLGWPIVFGPTSVDGSYLVHFGAPDGRAHDVFSFEV